MHLKNVTLELSSKPFHDETEKTMYAVARKMFGQWKNLTDKADMVSVMLWIADGSEILEYTGDLSRKFEWAYWCGCANHCPQKENATEREKINSHSFPKKYRPDAAPRPYSWLKRVIEVLREVGKEVAGKPIRIGAIFDNGPEFAVSDFKFNRHREIANGHTLFPHSFVTCNSTLHADPQAYAAFPNGIPEGISLGEFLGKQFQAFSRDLGYDYIWLSNGMGFGTETWGITGALFDKKQFYPEKADEAAATMLQFWRDFTHACPGVVIETRGSNFSAGVEIATDAAPLREVYRDFKVAPPVNSPWAALNYNSGLEIAAWMSHIAELPDDRLPFRFYTHDPWFMNSPWLDRYGREPWDIYQPLSVCRLDAEGKVGVPTSVSLLTVDDTRGQMPDQVPDEVIPHLINAFDCGPDAPGPLVWVYPFDEYSEMVRGDKRHPEVVFNEDMFIGETIQTGTPLNTVISTGNFRKLEASGSTLLDRSILIVSASAAPTVAPFVARGGKVIFYGSLTQADESLLQLLGLKNTTPLTGEVNITSKMEIDEFETGKIAAISHILPQFDGGGLTEALSANATGISVLAEAEQQGETRVIAMARETANGGKVGFIRSVMPCNPVFGNWRGFDALPPEKAFPVEKLLRQLLPSFGWKLAFSAFTASATLPRVNISRHDNAFFFSIFARDTTAAMRVNTPYGAPVLAEMETILDHGDAIWHPGKSWHKECRCFIKQDTRARIGCKIATAEYPEYAGRVNYSGLKDADVRFFPPRGFEGKVEAVAAEREMWAAELLSLQPMTPEWENTPDGRCMVFKNISGFLYLVW